MSTGTGCGCAAPRGVPGGRTSGAEPTAHVETVEIAGKSDVDDDQLGLLPVHQGQPGSGLVGLQDPEPVPPQVHGHQVGYVVIILDDHHGVSSGHHRDQPAIPRTGPSATVRRV